MGNSKKASGPLITRTTKGRVSPGRGKKLSNARAKHILIWEERPNIEESAFYFFFSSSIVGPHTHTKKILKCLFYFAQDGSTENQGSLTLGRYLAKVKMNLADLKST